MAWHSPDKQALPIRIFALSRFTVLVGTERLSFTHKAQNRPLDLLKALIAFGGRDVPETRVLDALWPNMEADAAERALSVALRRLRRLLECCTAIQRSGRCLTLDAQCIWVDAWAFERGLATAQAAPLSARASLLAEALRYYQRPLLWGEEAPWAECARERLRWKAVSKTVELCQSLTCTEAPRAVAHLYLAMIDAEPGEERLYLHLLDHYARSGANEEFIALYRRGLRALRAVGIEPSPHYESIYRSFWAASVSHPPLKQASASAAAQARSQEDLARG